MRFKELRSRCFGIPTRTSSIAHAVVTGMWLLTGCLFIVLWTGQTPVSEILFPAGQSGRVQCAAVESQKAVEQICKRHKQHG